MKTYTYEETLKASTEYFGNDLSARAFVDKYALRNENDELLEKTPTDMHRRIAKELARIEKDKFKNPLTEQEIFSYLDKFKSIIPQGSPMYGIGNKYRTVSLSNCFVVESPYDSYGGILKADQELVQISKRRGGIGLDISNLRPTDLKVNNAARSTTGTASWMERYSNTIREVGQCLRFDQRVLTKNGLVEIQHVIPNKDYVWTKEGWIKVLNKYANGRKKLFKLTTQNGYSVIASENHIFQTFNNDGELQERHLFELEAGEGITLCIGNNSSQGNYVELKDPKHKNSNNKPANCELPTILDEQLAYILGYSYGDGYVEYNNGEPRILELACSNDYEDIKTKLENYCDNVFSYRINRRNGDGDLERLSISNKTIVKFLEHNDLLKQKSANIIFPKNIIESPSSVQQAFISGYFDADGYASGKKKGYCFSSINKQFLQEVQTLLSTYGVASKIHFEDRSKQGWNTLYTLVVVGQICQQRFLNLILLSTKVQKSQHVSKRSSWLTPFKRKSFGITGKPFNYIPGNSSYMSLGCVCKLEDENIKVNTNLLQDTIYSIEEVNEHATFDLGLESEHMFWCEGLYVHNSGRRGALLQTISIHHPDILTFATIKNDDTKVTGANISIRLTDEFLNALKNNEKYEQRWPIDSKKPVISNMVSAKKIWDVIIHNAWLRAEPGLLFWDNIIKESPCDHYEGFETISCNPCLPKFAKVLTPTGLKDIGEINVNDLVWSEEGFTKAVSIIDTGSREVYEYKTTAGNFYSTKNHKIISNGQKIEIQNADTLDVLPGRNIVKGVILSQCIMDGLVIGDGGVHKSSNNLVGLYIGNHDQDYFTSEIKDLILKHRPGIRDTFYEIDTSITYSELPKMFDRQVPSRYLYGSKVEICSFLRGLYSANGSVCDNRVTLKSSSKTIIDNVQLMLSSIGIKSYYTTNKPHKVKFSNGEYGCKQSYDLNISTDREKFVNNIGFIQQYKNDKIKIVTSNKSKMSYDIIETNYIGIEETLDITVNNTTNTFWCQNFNSSNCGEINLCAYDSCRLLAINLFHAIKNPFTKEAEYDFDLLYQTTQTAQRLMDDIVDLEIEAINSIITKIHSDPEPLGIKQPEINLWNKILEKAELGRRTGTGITAIGDCMAALGIKYGSKASVDFTDQIYKTLKLGAYRSSVDIAKEIGPFPIWDHKKEQNNPFLLRIKENDPKLYADMKKYGRRNIAILTTAPTGTVSMMASLGEKLHGTTSGIEPLFKTHYIRRKKGNPGDNDFRSDFVDDLGDNWMEFSVYHPGVEIWMKDSNNIDVSKSPYVEADFVNWTNRVKLQAAAQRHIDHSISSTINLPNDVPEKEVAKIYLEAWKSGLKGITVYRDGCRTGVLVSKDNNNTKDEIITNDAPKRPIELDCDVYHISVKGQEYFVLVGLLKGKPYEIFAGKNGVVDKKVKSGTIIKQKRRRYKAVFDDDTELSPIGAFTTDEQDTLTRLISSALRHGTDVSFLVHQLEKAKGDMQSFSKCVMRALKKYIPDGKEVKGEECSECGNDLVRSEGCIKCVHCGYSRC